MAARIAHALMTNRYLLGLAIAVILVAGVSALSGLPRIEDPRITNRYPIVITRLPGASAERVEALVTEKLEEKLDEVAEIKSIDSVSRAEISILTIELEDAVDETGPAFSEIRDKLAEAEPLLPPEASPPFLDDKRGPVAFSLLWALVWRGESEASLGILVRLAEELADQLRNVPGTELVRLYGEPEEEITVVVDHSELAALGLTPAAVAGRVDGADAKLPSGVLRGSRSDLLLEVKGELDSIERIAEVPLLENPDGSLVRLGDVALVRKDWQDPPREIGLVDGARAVYVAARMEPDRRADLWAQDAKTVAGAFAADLGGGVELVLVFDQTRYTSDRLGDLAANLVAGAAVVVLVIVLLMGWRAALLVGLALPLSAALVLFGLNLSGNTLQQISVFGMIVALGILIDNAIVVVDEVRTRLATGMASRDAVAAALTHLAAPLFASTLTSVLAFLPILLLPGNVGDFVSSIGASVILALVASFALSMTILAALTGCYGARPAAKRRWWQNGLASERLARGFAGALRRGLQRPALALGVAAVLPAAGFLAAPTLGSQFFPRVDRDMFDVQLFLPQQSSLSNTRHHVEAADRLLRSHAEVRGVHWLVGGSFPSVFYNLVMRRDDAPHYAQGIVYADSFEEVKRLIPVLQRELDAAFPGAQFLVRQFAQGPPVEAEVEFELFGPSLATLQALGDELRDGLYAHPDVLHTRASLERGEPKLWVDVDEDEARLAGLTLADVAAQLDGNLEGATGGSVVEDLEELPVRIRFRDERRGDLTKLATSNLVSAARGEWVPLAALGSLRIRPELAEITRCDSIRCNRIHGYVRNDALAIDVASRVLAELRASGFALPAGYTLRVAGDSEEQADALGGLTVYLPVLVVMMVATIVLSFRSYRLAGVLFGVAGLSVGLALLSTWIAGFPVSFNSILGTIGLIGVALNDSIVVLAAIRANPAARAGDRESIVHEVMGSTRHVLSTTLTTMGGFLPLLLFIGGDFWPPLAIVLSGGVAGATLLALVYIPAAYVLVEARVARRFSETVPARTQPHSALAAEAA